MPESTNSETLVDVDAQEIDDVQRETSEINRDIEQQEHELAGVGAQFL